MPHLQDPHLLFSTLYYSNFITVLLLVHHFHSPHYDSVSSLLNRSLHILVPSFILVLVAFASCNKVFDRLFQNFVLQLNAFFMVILANFKFTIDFVQRNNAYTLHSHRARLPIRPFLMAGRGAYFGKTEPIRQAFRCCFRPGGTNSTGELLRHDSVMLSAMVSLFQVGPLLLARCQCHSA